MEFQRQLFGENNAWMQNTQTLGAVRCLCFKKKRSIPHFQCRVIQVGLKAQEKMLLPIPIWKQNSTDTGVWLQQYTQPLHFLRNDIFNPQRDRFC